jgi:predicted nucleotide-binding protein
MTVEQAKQIVTSAGLSVTDEGRITNGSGTKITLSNAAIINIYDKGSYNVQGQNADIVKALFSDGFANQNGANSVSEKTVQYGSSKSSYSKVFVVYGHDQTARTQLEAMLRRWKLDPIILDQLPSEGQTIIEKLENLTNTANFCVVLATPDDEGYRANHSDEKTYRARQNVVLELGMMLSKLGRPKVAILLKNAVNMERPSDIQGLIYISFTDNLEKECGVALAKEMTKQGYDISISNL